MAVVQATQKPPHYFLKHTVVVVTQFPLRPTLRSIDYVGRVVKRNMVLGASDVKRLPRALDKGLILSGLVVQSTESPMEREVNGQTKGPMLDRTKVLQGPQTQTYEETRHSNGLSARQNQSLAWSSDSSLWGN